MSRHPHVLIFDSGVGGLSVAREILAAYPQCQLTYCSDNAGFPYGSKASDWLTERVTRVMRKLILTFAPDVIVVACNTASTVTLAELRQAFATPFVGVVPAIKPAANISHTKSIGVLATPATVSRAYTHQLVADYASDCTVFLHGSSNLVVQAELKLMGRAPDLHIIAQEVGALLDKPGAEAMDTVVLACTHFPLLQEELAQASVSRQLQWVDSGEAIARRVGFWIGQMPPCEHVCLAPIEVVLTAPSEHWLALQASMKRYLNVESDPCLTVVDIV